MVQIADEYVIVLTPDGQFCRVPRVKGAELGMQLSFQEETTLFGRQPGFRRAARLRRFTSVAVAACLAVAVGVWAGLGSAHRAGVVGTPYALVSLDINPSVTLGVDPRMHVQSTSANDGDGQTVLSQLPQLAGESLQKAVAQIVSQAVKDNLVPQLDSIVIAAAPVQRAANSHVSSLVSATRQTVIQTLVQSGADQKLHPVVYSLSVPESVISAAQKADIPPGQVASYLYAQHQGVSVGIINATTVREILGSTDNSILNVDTTQTAEQLTTLFDKLKVSGVFENSSKAKGKDGKSGNSGKHTGQGAGIGSNSEGIPPSGGGGPGNFKDKGGGTGSGDSGGTLPGSGLTNAVTNILTQATGNSDGETSSLVGNTVNAIEGVINP